MNQLINPPPLPDRKVLRCAIYTRKSTEEGLHKEFNSLEAQREAAQNYIASQKQQGWLCLPERYDDGGFSGGNMQRPALTRLLTDIQAGHIHCVVVQRVDRLSRSLLDFAKMMEIFDKHRVAFVSITQQFSTATSMGRLVLNVLLSFAQFERELISERTRDKIAAARRKGKWSGGLPLLGYDIDPQSSKLLVNKEEAKQVRAIFALYLKHRSLRKVLEELDRRGWLTKRWRTRQGKERGGQPFGKSTLQQLLGNVLYLGQVQYKKEIHAGEHAALVDRATWDQVQEILQHQDPCRSHHRRNSSGALLAGLLYCGCGWAMTPTHAYNRTKRYRYYVCVQAQKRGRHKCPARSLPAGKIESYVIEQLRHLGQEPGLWQEHLDQARREEDARLAELAQEQLALQTQLVLGQAEVRPLLDTIGRGGDQAAQLSRLALLQEQIQGAEQRLTALQEETIALGRGEIGPEEMSGVLAAFASAWEAWAAAEQARHLRLVVKRVDYDASQGQVSLTFNPPGIKTLAGELAGADQEKP